MSSLPAYPEFAPLSLEMAQEISPFMVQLPDGISELSFAGLFLFRNHYKYKVSCNNEILLISGETAGEKFFITPCLETGLQTVGELFETHSFWKLISPSFIEKNGEAMEKAGYVPFEDRNNFDYLYQRTDLASLSGKKFHRKKNHVNAFKAMYPDYYLKPLDLETRSDAREVLEFWGTHEENPDKTDYRAAGEALDLLDKFQMSGLVLYVDKTPVAWTLAETVAGGRIAAVHFEKARVDYRGAYQVINMEYALSLPESVEFINREQDLGNEGMRQAKMTYRPCGFVKKYRVNK
ncbi:phosphatidylglycerol lysyltransferase domain-containing protein [Brucepastera parasyntrophica]|uniref:DUF2156 domain-containing protein n=1 Tax=Brucepastera parasyntrophica TaxID=2880008 RepID=UPI00210B291A|nr:phosphatidylglycerol lysyltransferase domain-containing protein [Brucepastera parasyntrophica]ULQ59014.1 phosphatidylglycerol lysyltransferase domain-containing protein [Brucepastera parasyntrophica]